MSFLLAVIGALVVARALYPMLYQLFLYALPPKSVRALYPGEWVVVTGSTEGIGKCLAKKFAELGYNVCQISRNPQKLAQTEREILAVRAGVRCKSIVADLSHSFARGDDLYEHIRNEVKDLDVAILVNNAGVIELGRFDSKQTTEEGILSHLNVNCLAVVRVARAILPQMVAQKARRSAVINVSSVAGEQSYASHAVYGASKAFVTSFSEALRREIEADYGGAARAPVDIVCFKPYYVQTQMVGFKSNPFLGIITPQQCVDGLLHMLGKTHTMNGHWKHVISGFMLALSKKLLPENTEFFDAVECKISDQIIKGW